MTHAGKKLNAIGVWAFERPEDEGVAAADAVAETPAERWRFSGGRDSETGSSARDPCGTPRNAGVQGGTESSNLLCSSSQSVSAVNSEAVGEKPRTLAAVCGWAGT